MRIARLVPISGRGYSVASTLNCFSPTDDKKKVRVTVSIFRGRGHRCASYIVDQVGLVVARLGDAYSGPVDETYRLNGLHMAVHNYSTSTPVHSASLLNVFFSFHFHSALYIAGCMSLLYSFFDFVLRSS